MMEKKTLDVGVGEQVEDQRRLETFRRKWPEKTEGEDQVLGVMDVGDGVGQNSFKRNLAGFVPYNFPFPFCW